MVRAISSAKQARGLCGTCRNVAECVHFARRGMVHYCELFESESIEAPAGQPGMDASPDPPPRSELVADDVSARRGLCANCNHRDTCALAGNSPAGVWYCEEYE